MGKRKYAGGILSEDNIIMQTEELFVQAEGDFFNFSDLTNYPFFPRLVKSNDNRNSCKLFACIIESLTGVCYNLKGITSGYKWIKNL